MKVICIDGKPTTATFSLPEGVPLIAYDENKTSYFIKGYDYDYKKDKGVTWGKRRFITLSNIDEMELLAERYGVFAENNF